MEYLDLARLAVEEAQARGAAASEAYLLDADSLTIELAEGKVETLKLAQDTGIGVRVISHAGEVGFAYSTAIQNEDIHQLIQQALSNSKKSFGDTNYRLPDLVKTIPHMSLLDPQIVNVAVEEKIDLVRKLEDAAKSLDTRITKSERCMYQDTRYGVALANSKGLSHYYRAGYCGLYGSVLANQAGDIQSGMSLSYKRHMTALDPQQVGREAAKQAIMLLGAQNIATTKATVLLSPYVSANFLSVLTSSFSADAVHKGKSIFRGQMEEKVMSEQLTIIDDGTLSDGIATSPIDGEGVLTQRTCLINNGFLTQFLHNCYTASRDGVGSTGNGVRNSFKSVTDVGPSNIYIQAGQKDPDELIGEVENGFYVTGVMGLHTANPISGDFSLGASGVWIKQGRFAHAVRGVAIAGNLLDLFSKVEAVGSDLTFFGSQGAPTMRVTDVTISG